MYVLPLHTLHVVVVVVSAIMRSRLLHSVTISIDTVSSKRARCGSVGRGEEKGRREREAKKRGRESVVCVEWDMCAHIQKENVIDSAPLQVCVASLFVVAYSRHKMSHMECNHVYKVVILQITISGRQGTIL